MAKQWSSFVRWPTALVACLVVLALALAPAANGQISERASTLESQPLPQPSTADVPSVIEPLPSAHFEKTHSPRAAFDAWQVDAAAPASCQSDERRGIQLLAQGCVERDALPGAQMERAISKPGDELTDARAIDEVYGAASRTKPRPQRSAGADQGRIR